MREWMILVISLFFLASFFIIRTSVLEDRVRRLTWIKFMMKNELAKNGCYVLIDPKASGIAGITFHYADSELMALSGLEATESELVDLIDAGDLLVEHRKG